MIVKVKWPEDMFRLATPAKPPNPLKFDIIVGTRSIYCSVPLGQVTQYSYAHTYDITGHSEDDRAN